MYYDSCPDVFQTGDRSRVEAALRSPRERPLPRPGRAVLIHSPGLKVVRGDAVYRKSGRHGRHKQLCGVNSNTETREAGRRSIPSLCPGAPCGSISALAASSKTHDTQDDDLNRRKGSEEMSGGRTRWLSWKNAGPVLSGPALFNQTPTS